ncbi:lysophospholipid acyltransferase family protein [Caballeronia ptereochthonis]|uniref:Phospholipid/glycerol acyltransferase n=1 Tax=Caballeronia ptereochthonis TaxID=1777144 RepID=A0A158C8E0_9BURK|nr:lysophospholipid acyltransferase family protein [Caballeronia ptereochthonis]SAK78176.1 phospholipid/glycerol acyltransferase [Caballeronia ptereochthonis]
MSDAHRKIGGAGDKPSLFGALESAWQCVAFYFALVVLAFVCLAWLPFAWALRRVLSVDAGRRVGRSVVQRVWHMYFVLLRTLGACRFDLSGLDSLAGQSAMILAPNHPCLLDALLIASRVPDTCCVMKGDVAGNVFLGPGALLAGYIVNDTPVGLIRAAVAELRRGSPLLLFPEGTRTERASVNPLKGGIALIAARAQVPVQTLIIETDSGFLGKGWQIFRKPALPITYRVTLGRRFAPPGRDHAALQAFIAELQRFYAGELDTHRPRD